MTRQPMYPDIEVRAAATKLFAAAFGMFPSLAQKYVAGFRFAHDDSPAPQPGKGFIPLDAWLATFSQVLAEIGPNALFQVGQRVMSNPHFADGTNTLEAALRQIDIAYHKSHRKGGAAMFDPATGRMLEGIGHYTVAVRPGEKKDRDELRHALSVSAGARHHQQHRRAVRAARHRRPRRGLALSHDRRQPLHLPREVVSGQGLSSTPQGRTAITVGAE